MQNTLEHHKRKENTLQELKTEYMLTNLKALKQPD
jgi:hypothetical protein